MDEYIGANYNSPIVQMAMNNGYQMNQQNNYQGYMQPIQGYMQQPMYYNPTPVNPYFMNPPMMPQQPMMQQNPNLGVIDQDTLNIFYGGRQGLDQYYTSNGATPTDPNPYNGYPNFMGVPIVPMQQYNMAPYGYPYGAPMMMQQPTPFGTLGYNAGMYPQYGMSTGINPIQAPYMQQQQTYTIEGCSPLGKFSMVSQDMIDQLDKLQDEYDDEVETENERQEQMSQSMGFNYYGGMNYNNYYILNKYKQRQAEILEQGYNNAIEFQKMMSRAAHHYLNDGVTDEEIDQMYTPKTVEVPQEFYRPTDYSQYIRNTTKWVPISEIKRNQFNAYQNQITEWHNQFIENGNIGTFLNSAGELWFQYKMEEVRHQRNNKSRKIGKNKFKDYINKNIDQRDASATDQITTGRIPVYRSAKEAMEELLKDETIFPLLSKTGSIDENGVLNISMPTSLQAMQNGKINEAENDYNANVNKFYSQIFNKAKPF